MDSRQRCTRCTCIILQVSWTRQPPFWLSDIKTENTKTLTYNFSSVIAWKSDLDFNFNWYFSGNESCFCDFFFFMLCLIIPLIWLPLARQYLGGQLVHNWITQNEGISLMYCSNWLLFHMYKNLKGLSKSLSTKLLEGGLLKVWFKCLSTGQDAKSIHVAWSKLRFYRDAVKMKCMLVILF